MSIVLVFLSGRLSKFLNQFSLACVIRIISDCKNVWSVNKCISYIFNLKLCFLHCTTGILLLHGLYIVLLYLCPDESKIMNERLVTLQHRLIIIVDPFEDFRIGLKECKHLIKCPLFICYICFDQPIIPFGKDFACIVAELGMFCEQGFVKCSMVLVEHFVRVLFQFKWPGVYL